MILKKLRSGLPHGFLKQLSWQYAATISVVVAGFIYTILVANKLGPSQLGIIALSAGVTTITAQLFNLSMKDVVIRYVNILLSRGKPDSANNILLACILANIIASTLYFSLIYLIAPFLNDLLIQTENGTKIIRLYSLILIFQILLTDSVLGYIRLRNALHIYASGQLIASVLRVIATYIGLWYFQMGIFFVVATTVITSFLTLFIISITTVKLLFAEKFSFNARPYRDDEIIKILPEIMRFLRNNYLTGLLTIPAKELDMNLLGLFTTVENIGIYKVAKNFISAIWAITDPVHLVIYPECTRFWAKNNRYGLNKFIKKVTILLLIFSIFIIVGSGAIIPFFIHFFIGEAFSYASTLFVIMVSSTIIWVPLLWIYPIFLTAARTDLALKAALIHSVVSVLLYLGFIGSFGLVGAAIAYALNAAFIALIQYYMMSKSSILNNT